MRTPLRILVRLAVSLTALLLVAGVAFANLSPELGGKPTKAQRRAYAQSGHYQDGEFRNLVPTALMTGGSSTLCMLWRFLFDKDPLATPAAPLPMQVLDSLSITRKTTDLVRVTWFGHSASLVEIAGQNILLDPMLSVEMGPIPWLTPNRYNPRLAITAEQLPPIDAVLISHDHYDHLDYQTIRRLKEKVRHFYVPLGVGAHLLTWGVAPARVTELDWNDSVQLPGLTIVSTPARHFSGRGLTNRNSTSWSSWVLKSATKRIFYSGDGGYGPHFRAIGQQHGPFDLALMECGQYDAQWAEIHMLPEQTVQATLDVRAQVLLPVHWSAFTEANHAWNDPVRRATAEAARLRLAITTPQLGQPVTLGTGPLPQSLWWQ
ncbi:MBL fold metallo-hydrolase [Hymenobacter elongatus]|uniref:MBL fold metallo-hydrolase n=1 Tax=Hymenobacter elongatus TaxID=877208 RepID=UPI001AEBE7EB|nr:MBL fold metallo-hydrolase [Hymenobacter elongatus]